MTWCSICRTIVLVAGSASSSLRAPGPNSIAIRRVPPENATAAPSRPPLIAVRRSTRASRCVAAGPTSMPCCAGMDGSQITISWSSTPRDIRRRVPGRSRATASSHARGSRGIRARRWSCCSCRPCARRPSDIAAALGDACIDLTGQADQLQAFAIVGRARLVLSEDSGLMHMAWVQGTPTLALFSSSRKDWSSPQGPWSDCLDSSDLPCGPCGLEVCKFGDNRCLTRYPAAQVLERAERLARPASRLMRDEHRHGCSIGCCRCSMPTSSATSARWTGPRRCDSHMPCRVRRCSLLSRIPGTSSPCAPTRAARARGHNGRSVRRRRPRGAPALSRASSRLCQDELSTRAKLVVPGSGRCRAA